jgi:hypothetical protein
MTVRKSPAKTPKKRDTLTGEVLKVEHEDDRTLLYLEFKKPGHRMSVDYYAIAKKDVKVSKGDTIEYEPYGYNFAWFVKKVN